MPKTHLINQPIDEVFETARKLSEEGHHNATTFAVITLALTVRLLAKAVADGANTIADGLREGRSK